MKKIARKLEFIYVLIFSLSLGLSFVFQPSMRAALQEAKKKSLSRRSWWVFIRVVARQAARELPWFFPSILLLSGALGFVITTNPLGAITGIVVATIALAMLPVLLPMPSGEFFIFTDKPESKKSNN